jgi:hypothetical protein
MITEACVAGTMSREQLVTAIRYTETWQTAMKGTTDNECSACGNQPPGHPTTCCPRAVKVPDRYVDPMAGDPADPSWDTALYDAASPEGCADCIMDCDGKRTQWDLTAKPKCSAARPTASACRGENRWGDYFLLCTCVVATLYLVGSSVRHHHQTGLSDAHSAPSTPL